MSNTERNPLLPWALDANRECQNRAGMIGRTVAAINRLETKVSAFVPETLDLDALYTWLPTISSTIGDRSTFAGAPVAVKEIIAVDGLPRRAGSLLPPEALESEEASVVSRLRGLGCVPFVHAVSTEFAYFHPGSTRNPHNTDHTPGGSSSGSAAAVAAGMCPLAIGTQTIGSVIRPASFCGIVGYKPTGGRLSRDGVFPVSRTLDQLGFFTQDLPGMKILAEALAIVARTSATASTIEYRLCVGPYIEQASQSIREAVVSVARALEGNGVQVMPEEVFANIEELNVHHRRIMARDFFQAHSGLFSEYGDRYRKHSKEFFEEGASITVSEYDQSLDFREREIAEFDTVSQVDQSPKVWLSPAAVGAAPQGIHSTGSPLLNLPWTHVGAPVLTVPVAKDFVSGLPLGIQIAAPRGRDDLLFAAAEEIVKVWAAQPNSW